MKTLDAKQIVWYIINTNQTNRVVKEVSMSFLKERRKELGISVKELAQIVGVTTMAIYNYENNKRQPRIDKLQKLTKALNCSIEALTKYFEK